MVEAGQKEEREKGVEGFSRQACIEHTLQKRTFPRYSMCLVGDLNFGFELEHLKGARIEKDDRGHPHLVDRKVNKRVEERVEDLKQQNQAEPLTDSQLDTILEGVGLELDTIGLTILARAEELGLVEIMTVEDYAASFEDPRQHEWIVGRTKDIDSPYNALKRGGWEIQSPGKKKHVLIAAVEEEGGEINALKVVDFDRLRKEDSEFVREKIRRHHELDGFQRAIWGITYNLTLHGIDRSELVPELVRHLADRWDWDDQTQQLQVFLGWMSSLGDIYRRNVEEFRTRWLNRGAATDVFKIIGIDSYLEHIICCPGLQAKERWRALGFQNVYLQLVQPLYFYEIAESQVGIIKEDLKGTIGDELLCYPFWYVETASESARQAREEIATQTRLADLIEDTKDLNGNEFLAELKKAIPGLAKELHRFRESLGKEYLSGESKFDEKLSLATTDLPRPPEGITFERVQEILEKSFSTRDSDLQSILAVLIVKNCKQKIEENNRFGLEVFYQKMVENLDEVIDGIIVKHRKQAEKQAAVLDDVLKEKAQLEALLDQKGITPKMVKKLVRASVSSTRAPRSSFTVALNALFLHARGDIDVSSPAFRMLIREVFPWVSDRVLRVLKKNADLLPSATEFRG